MALRKRAAPFPLMRASRLRGTPSPADAEEARERQERDLLSAARRDPAQFAPLYERYVERVYAYCLRRVGGDLDSTQEAAAKAEDLTSAIFTRALSRVGGYRGGRVSAWLFSIARSVVNNDYRARISRRKRAGISLDDLADQQDEHTALADHSLEDMLDGLVRREEHHAARRLIAQLSEDDRDLLALRIAAGLSADEIGTATGKSAGAVRVRLHRIITRLRMEMRREFEEESR